MVKVFLKPNLNFSKSYGAKSYTESTLFPILPLSSLLPEIEKNHFLNKLSDLVALPDESFHVLYTDLIEKFALFVQILPEMYGEELGGLLNEGLRRSLLATQIILEGRDEKPHPLFLYAVFSIALLSDIGHILNYRINIADEKGGFIDDWYPHLGSMAEFGEYFKMRPLEGVPVSLVRNVTTIFARQLLNDTAIAWLSSNTSIFDMWLAFLNKGEDWAGGLGRILRVDKKQFDTRKLEVDLMPVEVKMTEPLASDLAEKFWAWLKNGLADGSIPFNELDSKVHLVEVNAAEVGVFLQAPELFELFLSSHVKSKDWNVLLKQFTALGLTLGGSQLRFEQFFSENPDVKPGKLGFLMKDKKGGKSAQLAASAKNIKEGLIVKDAKMLFGAKMPPVSPYLKDIVMRWSLKNVLPAIRHEKNLSGQPDLKKK